MPLLVKADPQDLAFAELPEVAFTEWAYEHPSIDPGDPVFWFTTETRGGFGLNAVGHAISEALPAGTDRPSRPEIRFRARFSRFGPVEPLTKADFASLERIGSGSALQQLNRVLYLNSHNKITNIDDEVASYLARRFDS